MNIKNFNDIAWKMNTSGFCTDAMDCIGGGCLSKAHLLEVSGIVWTMNYRKKGLFKFFG